MGGSLVRIENLQQSSVPAAGGVQGGHRKRQREEDGEAEGHAPASAERELPLGGAQEAETCGDEDMVLNIEDQPRQQDEQLTRPKGVSLTDDVTAFNLVRRCSK
jgi:hypothetical protein